MSESRTGFSEINHFETTSAGVIDWKMEAERANRLYAELLQTLDATKPRDDECPDDECPDNECPDEECAARYRIAYDGFVGDVIGVYVTREGKRGVVLQQVGTRVVHVYGMNRLEPV